jgi:hypothetical protein
LDLRQAAAGQKQREKLGALVLVRESSSLSTTVEFSTFSGCHDFYLIRIRKNVSNQRFPELQVQVFFKQCR